jgi:hypothetical protein
VQYCVEVTAGEHSNHEPSFEEFDANGNKKHMRGLSDIQKGKIVQYRLENPAVKPKGILRKFDEENAADGQQLPTPVYSKLNSYLMYEKGKKYGSSKGILCCLYNL